MNFPFTAKGYDPSPYNDPQYHLDQTGELFNGIWCDNSDDFDHFEQLALLANYQQAELIKGDYLQTEIINI
jgi:hypothetical protein